MVVQLHLWLLVGLGRAGGRRARGRTCPKNTCMVCSKTTNKTSSNREGGVQCNVGYSWYHGTYTGISADMFDMICKWVGEGIQVPWKCPPCESRGAKLQKMVKVLSNRVEGAEKRMNEHDNRLTRVEEKGVVRDAKLENHDKEIGEQLAKMGENGGAYVLREIVERASKETNVPRPLLVGQKHKFHQEKILV